MICLAVDLSVCTLPVPPIEELGRAMRATAERLGLRVLSEMPAQFPDHGITYMMALAESHLVVSTWPEHHMAHVDLVSCRTTPTPERALQPLVDVLGAQHVHIQQLHRVAPGIPPEATAERASGDAATPERTKRDAS